MCTGWIRDTENKVLGFPIGGMLASRKADTRRYRVAQYRELVARLEIGMVYFRTMLNLELAKAADDKLNNENPVMDRLTSCGAQLSQLRLDRRGQDKEVDNTTKVGMVDLDTLTEGIEFDAVDEY
jgi:hypothetical protein